MSPTQLKNRRREHYPFLLDYRSRWSDNDIYDSIVNTYLIEQCGLHPPTSHQYGLVVHSHCDYFGSIAFPAVAELGLRVNKLGKTSCTYEIALFERGIEAVKSVGEIIHVFVDRETGRPAANGMDEKLREGLQKLETKIEESKL